MGVILGRTRSKAGRVGTVNGISKISESLLTPALSSFGEERENYFVGRFPRVGSHPPSSNFGATSQPQANFRSAFSAFEFAPIRAIRVKKFSRGSPHGGFVLRTGQNAPSGCRLVLFTSRLGVSTNHLCARTSRPARRTEGFGPRTRQPDARPGGVALRTDGRRPRTDEFAPCRDNPKRCRGRLEPRTDDLWPRTDKPKGCRDDVVCRREGIYSIRNGPSSSRDFFRVFRVVRGQIGRAHV